MEDIEVMQKKAGQILDRYRQVLLATNTETSAWGIPSSLLPCGKEEIKAAIRFNLACFISEGHNEEMIEALRVGYCDLSLFVNDDVAERSTRGAFVLLSGDFKHPDATFIDEAVHVMEEIHRQRCALGEELDQFIADTIATIQRKRQK